MNHVALLGDSIFDNAMYVPGGEPVIDQLRSRLLGDWRATLLACDGSSVRGVAGQLAKLPTDCTHVALSVGGNDALEYRHLLFDEASDGLELVVTLTRAQREFAAAYRRMLAAVLSTGRSILICTVYDSVPGLQAEEVTALSLFNDVIVRAAVEHRVPVLDLRFICTQDRDFADLSPIEPSETGGAKIASALARVLASEPFDTGQTAVYR